MCQPGLMNIRVNFNQSFVGAVHARDHRRQPCMVFGNGSNQTTLSIDLFAQPGTNEHCGYVLNNVSLFFSHIIFNISLLPFIFLFNGIIFFFRD